VTFPNQIPRVGEIVVPGIIALGRSRPTAVSFVQSGGHYADVIKGWQAQARMCLAYLTDQVVSARLGTASQPMAVGGALTELCRSEFDTDREAGAVAAVGRAHFVRAGGPGGAIPKGFRFRRDALASATPAVPAATYETTQDFPVTYQSAGQQKFFVPIVASKPGAAGNAPVFVEQAYAWTLGAAQFKMVDVPFDPGIGLVGSPLSAVTYEASGGLDSESDADLIAQASAYAAGQYGPVLGAILAGALRGTGAHRVVVRDIYTWDSDGSVAATTGVCIADASWAAGSIWVAQVQQKIQDNFQGFGQTVIVSGVTNVAIRVDCIVSVRDANSLADVSGLTLAIQNAVRAYFDDRPDWYTFRNAAPVIVPPTSTTPGYTTGYGGLRAAIAAADRRLLGCSSALVYRVSDNTLVTQPTSALPYATTGVGLTCTHWMLVQNGVNVTPLAPT